MKQVTGSNTPQATNKVSIQLTLDGHSFSAHGLDGEILLADVHAVAVMAAHREALRQVEEKLGDRIRYTTPLLREVQAGTPTVWAYRTAGLLYIKVYDGSLRFAGVIPAPDTADVCYFTERLEKEFALKSCELRISGDDAKACGKLLKGYFKRIVCE